MQYEKKYIVRWTPWLARVVILFVFAVFFVGGLVGYVIGRVSASDRETTNDYIPQSTTVQVVGITPTEVSQVVSEVEEYIKVYYDCPLSYDLQDWIRELCWDNGVPMPLVIATIEVESSFRADVVSGTNDYGLMQINTVNHEWLSEEYGITDFLDPYQNVYCGITILAQHYNRFEDIDKALMAYNLGAAGAKRLWDKGIYETSYTQKIRTAMEVYENEI